MFPEGVEMSNKMLAGLEMPQGAPKLVMTYASDAEKIGDLSVDAMTISMSIEPAEDGAPLPALVEILGGGSPELLKMVLGEEKVRMLIAAPDAKTLVMTLGGSVEGLGEAIRVAGGKGPIPADPGTAMVMRSLPKAPSMVALFNMGNLIDVIRTGMTAAGAPPEAIKDLPAIKCKTPIAFGLKAKGATLHTSLHVPMPVIKETVAAILEFWRRMQRDVEKWNEQIRGQGTLDPGDL